ncbi:T9SS type A sorting domain-containing protein [bacterium]|nr:T9SS type A sorting domain-containing protein [bacterium]
MNKYSLIFPITVYLFCSIFTGVIYSDDFGSKFVEIVQSDDDQIILQYDSKMSFNGEQEVTEEYLSHHIRSLPFGTVYLAVPDCDNIIVEVISSEKSDFMISSEFEKELSSTFGSGFLGFPAQTFYYAGNIISFRSINLLPLSLSPIKMNESDSKGPFFFKFRIRVKFINSNPGQITLYNFSPELQRVARSIVYNKDYFTQKYNLIYGPRVEGTGFRYIIITNDYFLTQIRPLAFWLIQKGLKTKLVTLSDIGGNTVENIKGFIQNAYDTWDIQPEYVLLIGDSENLMVATHDNYYPNTDNYYVMLDGDDYIADAFIGRIPADYYTLNCENIVNKILRYERLPFSGGTDWFIKATCVVANDFDPSDSSYYEANRYIRDLLLDNGFSHVDFFTTEDGNSRMDVREAINDGRAFLNFRGCASGDWPEPFNNILFYGGVANDMRLPIVTSVTCLTNCFIDYDDCFCESWIKYGSTSNPRGSVGSYGSTCASWNTLERSALDKGFYRAIFVDSIFTFGGAMVRGKLYMLEEFGEHAVNATKEYYDYNILGDPSLSMWTSIPHAIVAEYPEVMPIGPVDVDIQCYSGGSALKDALVCIANNDTSIYDYGYTDPSGCIRLSIFSITADTVFITITHPNHVPYIDEIPVFASGNYVMCSDHDYSDELAGNNDGYISPGERIYLDVELTNYGSETAYGVESHLRTPNPFVVIEDSIDSFGVMGPSSTIMHGECFSFSISDDCPNGSDIYFDIISRDETDSTWVTHLPVETVQRPELEWTDYNIDDEDPRGNGNSELDPSEEVYLEIYLDNLYNASLFELTGFLFSDDSFINIIDSVSTFAPVSPGGTTNNETSPFFISVNPGVPFGSIVNFTMIFDGDGGFYSYTDTIPFSLTIHYLDEDDPSGPEEWGYWIYDDTDIFSGRAPVYDWFEIAPTMGPGEIIEEITDADADTVTIPLPFPFQYYGYAYHSIGICSNGFVEMGFASYRFGVPTGIPHIGLPKAMMAMFWDDLDLSTGGEAYQYYQEEEHRWILEFKGAIHYGTTDRETFQLILYDPAYYPTVTGDGEIIFQYRYVGNINLACIGIENYMGDMGLQYYFNDEYIPGAAPIQNERAIKFTTNPPTVIAYPWVHYMSHTIDDSSAGDGDGIAEQGETVDLKVTISNDGSQDALYVHGYMEYSAEYLTVSDMVFNYGDLISRHNSTNSDDPFIVSIAPDAPDTLIYIPLRLWANDSTYVNTTHIPVYIGPVVSINENKIPENFELLKVYPNPFNVTTAFEVYTPVRNTAELEIFNLKGQIIVQRKQVLKSGINYLKWNGENNSGTLESSGIYIYRIMLGEKSIGGKLIMMK